MPALWFAPGTHKLDLSAREIHERGFDFPGLQPLPVRAGDVLLHNVRLMHGSHRSQGGPLRRTIYYESQSLAAMLSQSGPRPVFKATESFIRDTVRLLEHAIAARQRAAHASGEAPSDYQRPSGYEDAEDPQPGQTINLRPALGYNAYI